MDFLRRVVFNEETFCWNFIGSKTPAGYGLITKNRRNYLTHRLTYQFFKGEIPQGLDVDHLCRNRACCNPEHLEAVTRSVNNFRGEVGKHNQNVKKTHCLRGHPLFGDNCYNHPDGSRQCRKCSKMRDEKSRIKRKIKRMLNKHN